MREDDILPYNQHTKNASNVREDIIFPKNSDFFAKQPINAQGKKQSKPIVWKVLAPPFLKRWKKSLTQTNSKKQPINAQI